MSKDEKCPKCGGPTGMHVAGSRHCRETREKLLEAELTQLRADKERLEGIVDTSQRHLAFGYTTYCKHGFAHLWAMRLRNGETAEQHKEPQYPTRRQAAEAAANEGGRVSDV